MRVTGIEWDPANRRHFREHGRCRVNEVEDVLMHRCHPTRGRVERTAQGQEARWRFQGQTCEGRVLTVIAALKPGGVLRPITCWPLVGKHLDNYLAWRRTIRR